MKKLAALTVCVIIACQCFSQVDADSASDSISAEGRRLYRSEMASWYGTDIFLEQYQTREKIGGYFSYSDNEGNKCIFFSKGDTPRVLGTIIFNDSYNVQAAKTSLEERDMTEGEHDLYRLRTTALKTIRGDTLFKQYQHMNFNLIPLVTGEERKVYVLTGPEQNGIVVFGNDYLLTYDKQDNIIGKKPLHHNIITINFGEIAEKGQEVESTMHTHMSETGEFITPTDVCTLLLYEKFAKWKQHMVVSDKYVSIWNCETDQLVILTKEAVERIGNDHHARHKKSQ